MGRCGAAGPHNDAFRHLLLLLLCHFLLGHPTLKTPIAVLAANATHSEVARGENAGRTLHHIAVVRALKAFSNDAIDGRPLEVPAGPLAQPSEANGQVRLVVFLADSGSGQVCAAAQQVLSR